jgi:hypothetical protein
VRIPVTIRNGSAIRGAGVAIACLMPGLRRRSGVIAASYAAAWPVDRPGLQFFVVVPDEDEEGWKRAVLPVLSSGGGWTVVMSLAVLGVRRLPLPTPVAALLLGAGVTAADSVMEGVAERIKAKAMAAAAAADQAASAAEADSPV